MNETILHDNATVVPWPTGDLRMRLPDAPMWDEWAESARTTVRANPLVSLVAAVTLGAVFASVTRRPSCN